MKKTLALILAVLMLCSVVVIATSAEETATDWEALYRKYGINVYIGAPTDTPPVLDGTISTGEYTYERDIPYANLREDAPGEIQSSLKEYFAHDANYIYIGAQFEQKNDNRAYWIQWKPTNTFDVFRDDSDLKTYYYNRISLQLRWKEVEGEFGLHTEGTWGWTRPETAIRFPTNGLAGSETEYEYAASKITDEAAEIYTKTYEVRIAKAYIAEASQSSLEDVRVMPYWTWFHANLCNAAPLSTDLVVEISETDFTCYVPGDKVTYWFLICDEAPEGYEPVLGIPQVTTPPTTETPSTTEAPATTTTEAPATTTAAPTTTAKATTAAATTAAATTVAAEEGGCKGSIAITALAVLPTLAGGALLLKRRKED